MAADSRFIIDIGTRLDGSIGQTFNALGGHVGELTDKIKTLEQQQQLVKKFEIDSKDLEQARARLEAATATAKDLRKEFNQDPTAVFRQKMQAAKDTVDSTSDALKTLKQNQKLVKKFEMDVSRVETARESLSNMQKVVQNLRKEMAKNPTAALAKRFNAAKKSAIGLSNQLETQRGKLRETSQSMQAAGLSTQNTAKTFSALEDSVDNTKNSLSDARKAVTAMRREFKKDPTAKLADKLKKAEVAVGDLSNKVNQSEKHWNKSHRAMRVAGLSTKDLKKAYQSLDKQILSTKNRIDSQSKTTDRASKRGSIFAKSLGGIKLGYLALGGAALGATGYLRGATTELTAQNAALLQSEAQLGVSSQALQVWQMGAESVGLSAEMINDSFASMSEKLGELAMEGSGEALSTIKRLGLDIDELINMSPDQVLLKISQGLQEVENISMHDRNFLLESLMNDGSKLWPLLDKNAEKLREIDQIASERSLIITQEESDILTQSDGFMKELALSAKIVNKEMGLMGAEIFNALGPSLEGLFAGFADNSVKMVQQVRADGHLIAEVWGDAFDSSAVAGFFSDLAAAGADTFDRISVLVEWFADLTRQVFTYLPTYAKASFTAIGAYGKAVFETIGHYGDSFVSNMIGVGHKITAGFSTAFAFIMEYGGMAFAAIGDVAGKTIGFILKKLAGLIDGFALIGNIPGFESFGESIGGAAESLRGMASDAENWGESIRASSQSSANALRASAAESHAAAEASFAQADASIEMGKAAMDAAGKTASAAFETANAYRERKEAQRDINTQIREENRELGGLTSALDATTQQGKKYTSTSKDKAAADKAGSKASKAAKDALKEQEKATAALAKEQERITGLFTDAENKLKLLNEELLHGADAARVMELEQDKLTKTQAIELQLLEAQAVALQDEIDIREKVKEGIKAAEEALQLANIAVTEGTEATRIAELQLDDYSYAEAKTQQAIEATTKELEDRAAATEKARETVKALQKELTYERIKLEQGGRAADLYKLKTEGYTEALAKSKLAHEKNIELLKKQGEIAKTVNEGLTDAIMDAVDTGKFSFKSLADMAKNLFNNMVLRPVIQAVMNPISKGIGNIVGGFTNRITNGISNWFGGGGSEGGAPAAGGGGLLSSLGSMVGIGGKVAGGSGGGGLLSGITGKLGGLFTKAKGAYMAGGASGALMAGGLGFIAGKLLGQSGIGAGIGAAIGNVILPGLGGLIGGGLGALAEGIMGGKKKQHNAGIDLNYTYGEGVEGQTFKAFKKKKSFFRGNKEWDEFDNLTGEMQSKLDTHFSDITTTISVQASALGLSSAESLLQGFSTGKQRFDDEDAEDKLKVWLGETTQEMYQYAYENLPENLKNIISDGTEGALTDIAERFKFVGTVAQNITPMIKDMGLRLSGGMQGAVIGSMNLVKAIGSVEGTSALLQHAYDVLAPTTEDFSKQFSGVRRNVFNLNRELGLSGKRLITTKESLLSYIKTLDVSDEKQAQLAVTAMAGSEAMAAFSNAIENIKAMFSSTIEQINKDLIAQADNALSQQQKQQKYLAEADALYVQLQAETDPEKIATISKEINEAVSKTWQFMTDAQKVREADYLKEMLSNASDIAAEQLSTTALMQNSADDMWAAAVEQINAANTMDSAAATISGAVSTLSSSATAISSAANALSATASTDTATTLESDSINTLSASAASQQLQTVTANDAVINNVIALDGFERDTTANNALASQGQDDFGLASVINFADFAEGSHESGLHRVPKDNYRAILHQNELIARANEADLLRSGQPVIMQQHTIKAFDLGTMLSAANQTPIPTLAPVNLPAAVKNAQPKSSAAQVTVAGDTVNITVNAAQGQNAAAIAREIERILKQRDAKKARRFETQFFDQAI